MPLRERREEIPPLIDHYLRKFAEEQKKGRLTLDDETLEYLVLYSWPGNIRQLVNEINRVVDFGKEQAAPEYDDSFLVAPPSEEGEGDAAEGDGGEQEPM